jgi:hypothetical protein
MRRHRPDIAKRNASGRQPFPTFAAVFAHVDLGQSRRIKALGSSRILSDLAKGFSLKSGACHLQPLGATIPATANEFVSGEKKHSQRFHDHPPLDQDYEIGKKKVVQRR